MIQGVVHDAFDSIEGYDPFLGVRATGADLTLVSLTITVIVEAIAILDLVQGRIFLADQVTEVFGARKSTVGAAVGIGTVAGKSKLREVLISLIVTVVVLSVAVLFQGVQRSVRTNQNLARWIIVAGPETAETEVVIRTVTRVSYTWEIFVRVTIAVIVHTITDLKTTLLGAAGQQGSVGQTLPGTDTGPKTTDRGRAVLDGPIRASTLVRDR
jgi:hypothetical protein